MAQEFNRNGLLIEDAMATFQPYVRALVADGFDQEGLRLRAGTQVLANPAFPTEFMRDDEQNRVKFQRNDYTWTTQARTAVWFGSDANVLGAFRNALTAALTDKSEFTSALETNLASPGEGVLGHEFPCLHPPLWYSALPWEPKVRRVTSAGQGELTAKLVEELQSRSGTPAGLPWPADWTRELAMANSLSVYTLAWMGLRVDVVAAFVTPVEMKVGDTPRLVTPDGGHAEMIRRLYAQWRQGQPGPQPKFTYYSIGSHQAWAAGVRGAAEAHSRASFCAPCGDRWECRVPRRYGDRYLVRSFEDRLLPETHRERTSRVKLFVDTRYQQSGAGGSITVERIRNELPPKCDRTLGTGEPIAGGYRESQILQCLTDLQAQGRYTLYHVGEGPHKGQVAIKSGSGSHLRHVAPVSSKMWLWLISAAVAAAPPLINYLAYLAHFGGTPINVPILVTSLASVYTVNVLSVHQNRLKEAKA